MAEQPNQLPQVTIYTDGSSDPNPGPGGWAAVLRFGEHERELSGGVPSATNNRMELRAAVEALQALKEPCRIDLFTDSEYLRRGITEWLPNWQQRGWRTQAKKPVANQDLWQDLLTALQQQHVEWHWVKGHAGHALNERVDRLARAAIPRTDPAMDDAEAVYLFTAVSGHSASKTGAWAAVLRQGDDTREVNGYEENTTTNRLHILAVAKGLRACSPGQKVYVYTPSDYVQQGASLWLARWQSNGWQTKDGRPVKNKAAWQELAQAAQELQVAWQVLKGEENIPDANRARELAQALALERRQ